MNITDATPTCPDLRTGTQPFHRHSRPQTQPPMRPQDEQPTPALSLLDPCRYVRDEAGIIWLVYRDGSKQRVESIPNPSSTDQNRPPFDFTDLLAALFVLFVIGVIGFITVIAF
jgi:hypothetical protein